jgi:hypothetical protein
MRRKTFGVILGGSFHWSEFSARRNSKSDEVKTWSAWSVKYWAIRGKSILDLAMDDAIVESHLLGIYTKQVAVGVYSFEDAQNGRHGIYTVPPILTGIGPEPSTDRTAQSLQVLENSRIFTSSRIFNVAVNMAVG